MVDFDGVKGGDCIGFMHLFHKKSLAAWGANCILDPSINENSGTVVTGTGTNTRERTMDDKLEYLKKRVSAGKMSRREFVGRAAFILPCVLWLNGMITYLPVLAWLRFL